MQIQARYLIGHGFVQNYKIDKILYYLWLTQYLTYNTVFKH